MKQSAKMTGSAPALGAPGPPGAVGPKPSAPVAASSREPEPASGSLRAGSGCLASGGSVRSGAMPSKRLAARELRIRFVNRGVRDPAAASRRKSVIMRCSAVAPLDLRTMSAHSAFMRAMSTWAGHSVLQALQATQVSMTSRA
ncbi:MAG TPA: hypothetical protein VNE62_11825 [Actinomycetota bacterium]|nr:hypothetical protein [Actinomycetota bacterium]